MRVLALVLALAVVSGCATGGGDDGGSAATFGTRNLQSLVLLPGDLPRGFRRFDWGPQIRADAPLGERSDPQRFGRIEGWKARYKRAVATSRTSGPLVIESRADLFETASGAEDELDAHRDEVGASQDFLDVARLGDGSFASRSSPGPVTYYLFAWRVENATASLLVSGFARRLTLDDALALARRQERRMTAAAGA